MRRKLLWLTIIHADIPVTPRLLAPPSCWRVVPTRPWSPGVRTSQFPSVYTPPNAYNAFW